MRTERKQAASRKRRIIMNNDGNECNPINNPGIDFDAEPKNARTFLDRRTSALAGSHVDAIFYCTGVFNLYTHHSTVSELQKRDGGGSPDWGWRLKETDGRDTLETIIDFGHQHGMEVFWSMRMNDVHDASYPHLMADWKKTHPEYMMGWPDAEFPYGDERARSAVNYELPEVRDKVFAILEDVCRRYDVDGVELDFFRHPHYFRPQLLGQPVTQAQCDLMTELLARLRSVTDAVAAERRRPMLIAVRVPDSMDYAKGIGLDLRAWLEQDLIDIMIGGGYFHLQPWQNMVAVTSNFDVPFYACLSASRIVDPARPGTPVGIEIMRGEARRAWQAGVSGIYTFNCFDPKNPMFRELGDGDLLRRLPSQYVFNPDPLRLIDRFLKDGSRFLIGDE